MVALTTNEILDELNKLGIYSHAELKTYSNEYVDYFSDYLKNFSF